jgi:enterochelin esterase-like enzyme
MAGTNCCFGWGSWDVDKTADELSSKGKMREVILVAVDNSAARMAEYSGHFDATNTASGRAFENYTSFLIHELKPKIDRDYRTKPGPADTGVMGSSMGGICSLALAWEHPEVFGCAASLSGAFQIEHANFVKNVLQPYHGKPKGFRIYLDSGVVDFMGRDDGRAATEQVVAELRRIGWKRGLGHYVDAKPLTEAELEKAGLRPDKWHEAATSQHNEFYWRVRSWRALTFMFPP